GAIRQTAGFCPLSHRSENLPQATAQTNLSGGCGRDHARNRRVTLTQGLAREPQPVSSGRIDRPAGCPSPNPLAVSSRAGSEPKYPSISEECHRACCCPTESRLE